MAEDLYTIEEREGPTNREIPGRRSLADLEGEKLRNRFDAVQKRRDDMDERRAELDEAMGVKTQRPRALRVRPAKQYSLKGVNTEAGGRITGEIEVSLSPWIARRIRDGSLEVVGEGESEVPADAEEGEPNAEGAPATEAAPANGTPARRAHRRGPETPPETPTQEPVPPAE